MESMNRFTGLNMHYRSTPGLAAFILVLAVSGALAQDKATTKVRQEATVAAPTESAEAAAVKGKSGRTRDPFFNPSKYVAPPKPVKIKIEPKPVPAPGFEDRLKAYREQLRLFLGGSGREPSKTSAYLIEELTVTGVFRNEDGLGAFVVETATKNQQTYFVRQGWATHDGYIKDILPNGVMFVRNVKLDNGTVKQVEEFRALPALNGK